MDQGRFSEREKEVIALLLHGKSNKQIALELRIAQSTVEYHLKNIYQKLGVGSRTEAVLQLGKTTGKDTPNELSETRANTEGKDNTSDARPVSISNVPRNRTYWGIVILAAAVVVIMLFYFYNWSAQNTKPTLCAPPDPKFTEASDPAHSASSTWQDQILYELRPEKFSDGDPTNNDPQSLGEGDIAGIRKEMPYLKSLGVTSIFFGPVLSTPPYDQKIDPSWGTNEELSQLVDDMHSNTNGPRLNFILDLRFSTTETDHPWTTEHPGYYLAWNRQIPEDNIGCSEGDCEPYILPDSTEVDHGLEAFGLPKMPLLNHTAGMDSGRGAYRDITNTIFWLVDTFDIDGFRYANADFYCATFWPNFMSDFRDRYGDKPEFWHIAEVFYTAKSWQIPNKEFIGRSISVGPIWMDGVYDFALQTYIQEVFAKSADPNCVVNPCNALVDHLVNPGIENPERLIASVNTLGTSFLQAAEDKTEKKRLLLAYTFLLTSNRVPLIPSGTEYGIEYDTTGALFSGSVDQAFHEEFKKLIQIRRDHPAFRRGSLTPLNTAANILSFARQYEDKTFLVVLNIDENPGPEFEIDLRSKGIACKPVTDLLGGNDQTIQPSNAGVTVTLAAWEAKIIQCE